MALALTSIGCGRIGYDALALSPSDAGTDAAAVDAKEPACEFGPWQAPELLSNLNSGTEDYGPHLSADRLFIYFESDRPPDYALWTSRRETLQSAWLAPQRLASLDTLGANESNPTLSPDGLTLHFTADRIVADTYNLYRSTRDSPTDDFVADELVAELAGEQVLGQTFSDDQKELIFNDALNAADFRRSLLVEGAWAASTPIDELNTASDEGWGTLSKDGLSMYFSSDRSGPFRIYLTTRSAPGNSWSAPQEVTAFSDPTGGEFDPMLSADALELVFSSSRTGGIGQHDLYSSTRECL